jgi:hypothetical protein
MSSKSYLPSDLMVSIASSSQSLPCSVSYLLVYYYVKKETIKPFVAYDVHYPLASQNSKKRILVVDNEKDVTITLQVGLEDGGFDVDTFTDPSLALKSFKPNFYDLVLIDIVMPERMSHILCLNKTFLQNLFLFGF